MATPKPGELWKSCIFTQVYSETSKGLRLEFVINVGDPILVIGHHKSSSWSRGFLVLTRVGAIYLGKRWFYTKQELETNAFDNDNDTVLLELFE